MDVADMYALMAAMQKPEMADAMEYDGVVPESLVILVEEKLRGLKGEQIEAVTASC